MVMMMMNEMVATVMMTMLIMIVLIQIMTMIMIMMKIGVKVTTKMMIIIVHNLYTRDLSMADFSLYIIIYIVFIISS